jgi:hypothetical protein
MCPACFAAAAWIAAGAGSAGGLTAFVVARRRERKPLTPGPSPARGEESRADAKGNRAGSST